jgi:hypothetical protein
MDKNLLMEIERLRGLISYDRAKPLNYESRISEQVPGMPNQGMINTEVTDTNQQGWDEDYSVVEIGPFNNPKYPTMLDVKLPVITKPREEPSIKQFNSETSISNFLPSDMKVKTFVEGDKLSNGKPAPVGTQYYEKADGKKYCLPVSDWVKLHTDKKYVYQFTNQKTGDVFGLKFALDKNQVLNGVTYKGSEISQMCPGGNNGWVFVLNAETSPPTMFFNKKTGQYFNPTKDGNSQSDFDDWWDEWKTWVEIGVGVLAGFLTGGLANIILGGARVLLAISEVGSVAYRVGRFVIFLGETAFVSGSETSWLRLIGGILLEAGMMTPIAFQYIEEGDNDQAILAWAFSLLPFLTELPAVARYIRVGSMSRQEADILSNEILSKMKNAGGYKTITQSINSEYTYVSSLSEKAKGVYMGMKRMIVEKPKLLNEGFELGLRKNSDKIIEAAERSTNAEVKTALQKANNQLNPLPKIAGGGKGFIPVVTRAFQIVTPIILGSTIALEYFKSLGLSEKVTKDLSKQVEKSYNSSQYWIDLASLNESLGISEKTEEQVLSSLKTYMQQNKVAVDEMINSGVAKENFFSEEKISPLSIEESNKDKDVYNKGFESNVKEFRNSTEALDGMARLKLKAKTDSLRLVIKSVGYVVSKWTDTTNTTKWTFITDQNLMGEVIFNETDKTYYVIVDNKRVT